MKNYIITGLDVGTNFIKTLTVLKRSNSEELEVLSKVQLPNSGMRRGVIVKVGKVSQNINKVIKQAQSESRQKIKEVYANIGGSHIFLTSSRGSVVISRADHNISQEDIERVVQAAKTFSLPPNKEIIDFFPKQFMVDGEVGIKEPLEMKGIRLETEVLAIGAFSPYFKNLTEACLNAGVQIADVVCNPIASAEACLAPQQKELGVVLLDIGAGTTDLAIYEEGDLVHLGVIPVGSSHITNDIAIGLRTDTKIAEEIKKEFGRCFRDSAKKNKRKEKIELPSATLTFSSKLLTNIIEARVSEIFDLTQKEIKKVSSGILPAGVVITGGGASLPGIVDLAKKELKLPCRIGIPILKQADLRENITEDSGEEPSFSTAWGLVLSGVGEVSERAFPTMRKGLVNKIKKIFRVFIP